MDELSRPFLPLPLTVRWRDLPPTLDEVCLKTGWQVHAYCLMSNHFHLVIETPQADLVAGLKWFLVAYTPRFKHPHKLYG